MTFALATALIGAASPGFSLAVFNNSFGIAQQNNIVRIQTSKGSGSGTVLDVHDGTGGKWFCILTADHVVNGTANFKFGSLYNNSWVGGFNEQFLGSDTATTGLAKPIDLAVVDVFVDNASLALLPAMGSITLGGGSTNAGNQAVLAGYGDQIDTVGISSGTPYFSVDSSKPLTYLTGTNTYTSKDNGYTHTIYTDDDWAYKANFTVNAGTVTEVDAYILSGDSGGPTFMSNGSGGLNLVGVHSTSDGSIQNNKEYVFAGYDAHDVNVNSYLDFINDSCQAVPEPSSLALLAVCGLALLASRRFAR